jgi:hypothetical protein
VVALGVDDAAGTSAGDEGFALSGFPEFVRSDDGFWGDASRELEAEELTDFETVGVAAAPRRAASWDLVTHTSLPSDKSHTTCGNALVGRGMTKVVAWDGGSGDGCRVLVPDKPSDLPSLLSRVMLQCDRF